MADLLCQNRNAELLIKLQEQSDDNKKFIKSILDNVLLVDARVLNGTIRNEDLLTTFSQRFTGLFEQAESVSETVDTILIVSNDTNLLVSGVQDYQRRDSLIYQNKLQDAVLNLSLHLKLRIYCICYLQYITILYLLFTIFVQYYYFLQFLFTVSSTYFLVY